MSTAAAAVEPTGVAQDLVTLAAALAGQAGISSAVVVPSEGNVDVGRHHVLVASTGVGAPAAETALTTAISTVGNCQILAGTTLTSVA